MSGMKYYKEVVPSSVSSFRQMQREGLPTSKKFTEAKKNWTQKELKNVNATKIDV